MSTNTLMIYSIYFLVVVSQETLFVVIVYHLANSVELFPDCLKKEKFLLQSTLPALPRETHQVGGLNL